MKNTVNSTVSHRHNACHYFEELPDAMKDLVVKKLGDAHQAGAEKSLVRLSVVSKNMRGAVRDSGLLENAKLRYRIYNNDFPILHLCDLTFADHEDPSVSMASAMTVVRTIQDTRKPIALIALYLIRNQFINSQSVCDAVQQRLKSDVKVVKPYNGPM